MPFQILRGDITRQRVDAIVNAANSSLLGGGGVDGAIHRAAGPKLLEECRLLGGCRTGEAKATGAYELQARYVIHTVGPVWYGGARGEEALLTACYENSLHLAQELGCGSVAFPLISAGVYGYPLDAALAVATGAIRRFLENSDMEVRLVLFYGVDVPLPPEVDAALSWRLEEAARPGDVRYRGPALKSQSSAPAAQSRPRMAVAGESSSLSVSRSGVSECEACAPGDRSELDRLLTRRQENFSQALMRLIDESGLSDSECYKRANIDRRHFSKIRSNPEKRTSFWNTSSARDALTFTRSTAPCSTTTCPCLAQARPEKGKESLWTHSIKSASAPPTAKKASRCISRTSAPWTSRWTL